MSEISVNKIELLPMLSVVVGDQAILLDPDTGAELYDALYAIYGALDAIYGEGELDGDAYAEGLSNATYQRPTVVFRYSGDLRHVVPDTIRAGLDDVLLVGLELSKGSDTHSEPRVKSYSTGQITDLSPGHPVTWPVSA